MCCAFFFPCRVNIRKKQNVLDSSNKMTISLALCKDCACVRTAQQGGLSKCGILAYFDNVCLVDLPSVASNLAPTSGSLNTTISAALADDDCVFYYAQMQPRSEYTARSRMFKISSQVKSSEMNYVFCVYLLY